MKSKIFLLVVLLSQLLFSCHKEFNKQRILRLNEDGARNDRGNPHLKMAIVSDIHYMHPSLLINNGAEGTAFQNYLNQDPKLLQFSDPIWRQVMSEIKAEKPDILLVP